VRQNEGVATQTDVRPDSTTDESTGDDRPSTAQRSRGEAAMDTPLLVAPPALRLSMTSTNAAKARAFDDVESEIEHRRRRRRLE
jgi:hypothetical protein